MKPILLCAPLLLVSVAVAQPRSWVQLSARTNATQYIPGAPIDVTLKATNTSSHDAWVRFSSGQRFELQLFDANSKTRARQLTPLYTWSTNRMFPMMVGSLHLPPSQSQTFQARIGDEQGALVPGLYELRARLTNSSNIEAKPVQIEVVPAPLQFKVSTDKAVYKVGEPVSFSITLSNTSQTEQKLSFFSGQRFDVSVVNEAGTSVWNWAANKRFIESISNETLAPGQMKTYQAQWDGQPLPEQKIASGTYSVQGVLTSRPRLESPPLSIEIK